MDAKKESGTPACFNCGNTSDKAALFRVLIQHVEQWVCARCLPFLIHGPH
jgi:hypothetical protein